MYLGLPSFVIIFLAAALAATFYGLLALWASAGRLRWYWHSTPLALALAALVPMGGHEPLLIFGSQAAAVVCFAVLATAFARWRGWELDATPISQRWRFSLRDSVLAILLAAVVLAIARTSPPAGDSANQLPGWRFAVTGLGFGVVAISAMSLIGGRVRWYLRIVLALFLTGCGAMLIALGNLGEPFIDAQSGIQADDWASPLASVQWLATAAWLLLARLGGWSWWQRGAALSIEQVQPHERRAKLRGITRFASRAALLASSVMLAWLVGELYWNLLPPLRFPKVVLPSPNGSDDLLVIDKKLDWSSIPGQEVDQASDEDCVRFVEVNGEAIDLLRAALQKHWLRDVDYFNFSASMAEIQAARGCCRALVVDARRQLALGRPDLAVQDYLDIMHLGSLSASGGLVVDELVAVAIVGVGVDNLTHQLDRVDPALHREIALTLDVLDGLREPLPGVFAREVIFEQLSGDWVGRLTNWAYRGETGEQYWYFGAMYDIRKRGDALSRLLMTEAAIRAYEAQHKELPADLNSLAPEYLTKVPADPFASGPLVYRRTDDGYLLYSVGGNGVDDGGRRTTMYEAVHEKTGDLFFDASTDVF